LHYTNQKIAEIKGIIFDMDGLLFDTERLYLKAWPPTGEIMGIPITEEVARKTIALGGYEMEEIFQAHYGLDFTLEKARPVIRQWITDYVAEHGLPVRPGAREAIAFFHKRGFPLAIGSSNLHHVVVAYLEEAGLLSYFSTIVTGDMVERVKPAPDIFLQAAANLGLRPEECLVFEDSPPGIEAAHKAGCVPIMVPDLLEPCDVTRDRCWQIFSSLEGVPQRLFD